MYKFNLHQDFNVHTDITINVNENMSLDSIILTVNCQEIEIDGEIAERIFKAVQIRVENRICAIQDERREQLFIERYHERLENKIGGLEL